MKLNGLKQATEIYQHQELHRLYQKITTGSTDLHNLYKQSIDLVEQLMWQSIDKNKVDNYQQICREYQQIQSEEQHHFTIVIPVADRPQHLQTCLNSLLEVCRKFYYGGINKQQLFEKISVMIADDSIDKKSIARHRTLAEQFSQQGLLCNYFGLQQQQQLLDSLNEKQKQKLQNIIGKDSVITGHKGASIMRNLCYLKLADWVLEKPKRLIYFIDSDQEFNVKHQDASGSKNWAAINYFYHFDQLFSQNDLDVLTGKVVGDPPVSPAVMAGNFVADVDFFLHQMAKSAPQHPCQFHQQNTQQDGAYHDMGDLFGFSGKQQDYHYPCPLKGKHSNQDCFADFSSKLQRFFYGEHPTRSSFYQHQKCSKSLVPARTIYTGNYLFNARGIKYFIPFAPLKLRMAGPTLGRIIQAQSGSAFASANLPMLHKRTFEDSGQSEFRPGIEQKQQTIDLSGEFERQFFGDVMLFSVAQLCNNNHFPQCEPQAEILEQTVKHNYRQLQEKYRQKQQQILHKLNQLEDFFNQPKHWWQTENKQQNQHIMHFIDNIKSNFSPNAKAWQLIDDSKNKKRRIEQIQSAIKNYKQEQESWQDYLQIQQN